MKFTIKLAFILVLFYGLFYLDYFWQTPLGQTPVLDASENIHLAQQISDGSLPKEPFFRSMLYPVLLSLFCGLGFDRVEELFWIASLIGMLFHFASTFLVYLCSKTFWKNDIAALSAILLYGLYPPAVFFAAEPIDTTVSITFMLLALYFLIKDMEGSKKNFYISSGFFAGISCLFRSNLIPFAAIYVALAVFDRKRIKGSLVSIFVMSLMMIVGGIACYLQSKEFRLLPWQGASNLYSANSKSANGKYYKHSVYIPERQIGMNPARQEAEIIYAKETGKAKPFEISEFNNFWLNKTLDEIKEAPSEWAKLILKKTYFLFNNYEQYNNKTFGFHKAITPILRYNPLCFGFLLVLFFLSIANVSHSLPKSILYGFLTSIAALSIGIVAFYVSARFRLPIAPLLTILASGIFNLKAEKYVNSRSLVIAALCSFVSFSSFFGVSDTSTWKEDRLLNAFACSRMGFSQEQILWADRVLIEEPTNLQAIRIKLVGFTNLALNGELNEDKDWEKVTKELKYLDEKSINFDDTILLSGCYAYRFENNEEKAYRLWNIGGAESLQPEFFRAMLIYTNKSEVFDSDLALAKYNPILWAAIEKQNKVSGNNFDKATTDNAKKALRFLTGK